MWGKGGRERLFGEEAVVAAWSTAFISSLLTKGSVLLSGDQGEFCIMGYIGSRSGVETIQGRFKNMRTEGSSL